MVDVTLKVLIVEDDQHTLEKMGEVVAAEGYEVALATSGEQALELLEEREPHVLVTDLKMAQMSGLDLARRVRDSSPNTGIILVTAYGGDEVAISALRAGAIDYLKKPLDVDELVVALARARERLACYFENQPFPALLLAEDEAFARKHLKKAIESEGMVVFTAADGEEALGVFRHQKVDIALLDIKMPKVDGLQALQGMRELSDDFEAILISGHGDERAAVQGMRNGAMSFLSKPLDLDEFFATVAKALERLNARRALRYRARPVESPKPS